MILWFAATPVRCVLIPERPARKMMIIIPDVWSTFLSSTLTHGSHGLCLSVLASIHRDLDILRGQFTSMFYRIRQNNDNPSAIESEGTHMGQHIARRHSISNQALGASLPFRLSDHYNPARSTAVIFVNVLTSEQSRFACSPSVLPLRCCFR
ncbi:uncharacterized protein ARMOST_01060 [Armillaria ostoyae]|uniref:Uncharacterized protein n=1 Tax=Armillaria ostoyae TaxID=47428 RepID=A0A284QMU9_ARMOS|nr:uncharacterized protein ARMOST_01060 [Armillaria ostoyae]